MKKKCLYDVHNVSKFRKLEQTFPSNYRAVRDEKNKALAFLFVRRRIELKEGVRLTTANIKSK